MDFINFLSFLYKNKNNLSIDCMLLIKIKGINNLKEYKINKKYSNKCNNVHSDPISKKIKN